MTLTPDILKAALEQLFELPFDQIQSTFSQSREVATQFQELAPIVREQWREKETQQLRLAWGDEYDAVYDYLSGTVYPALPAHEQQLYNNAAGLQVLAQRYRPQIEEKLSATPGIPAPTDTNPGAPGGVIQGRAAAGNTPTPSYKQSAILALSPADYEAQRPAIEQAFQSGAVEFDI